MTTVFVTAFLDIYKDRSKQKNIKTCFHFFNEFATLNIPIHLFVSPSFLNTNSSFFLSLPDNVHITPIDLEDLSMYKELQFPYKTPPIKSEIKDTSNFMILMNAKIEFIKRSIDSGIYPSATHYSWIDFSLFYVFTNWKETSLRIKELAESNLKKGLLIPGIWEKGYLSNTLFEKINWRFCGGFFIGDIDSLEKMNLVYKKYFKETVEKNGLTWETNLWHFFELKYPDEWNPIIYSADHNDSIIQVPYSYFL